MTTYYSRDVVFAAIRAAIREDRTRIVNGLVSDWNRTHEWPTGLLGRLMDLTRNANRAERIDLERYLRDEFALVDPLRPAATVAAARERLGIEGDAPEHHADELGGYWSGEDES